MLRRLITAATASLQRGVGPRALDALPGGRGALSVLGHRGFSSSYPENTLPAFEACAARGVGIELDVGTSRDGHLVILHDETLDRTTDGRGELAAHTLDQLRALDAGSRFHPSFAGTPIPTLDEVLERHARQVVIDVELKTDPDPLPLARRLDAALRRHDAIDAVFVTSFDPFVLAAVAEVTPGALRGQIVGTFAGSRLPSWQRTALRRMWLNPVSRPDLIVAEEPLVTPRFLDACARRGWPVLVWTVNEPGRARALLDLGALGVITDAVDDVAAVARAPVDR
jgi:glycerophosphoryl diester phosphodiesterase